jgi:CheY-like chemotaxis protein
VVISIKGQLILCVDDNLDIRDLITLILEDEGYEVISASQGEAALALIKERKPALILLDVMMPGISGLDVLRTLRSLPDPSITHTPVIVITAKSQSSDIDEALGAGATSYIVKPFRPEALIEKVQKFLPVKIQN